VLRAGDHFRAAGAGVSRPPLLWNIEEVEKALARRSRRVLHAQQLAGKGEGLLGRDQPHLFDGLAAAAQELLLAGMGTAFDASGIEVDGHATDFAAVG
jgi:hypothetical protein